METPQPGMDEVISRLTRMEHELNTARTEANQLREDLIQMKNNTDTAVERLTNEVKELTTQMGNLPQRVSLECLHEQLTNG